MKVPVVLIKQDQSFVSAIVYSGTSARVIS